MPDYSTLLSVDSFVCHTFLYSFSVKPYFIIVPDSSLQNRRATCSVPYSAFLNLTYNISFMFLFFYVYFLYRLGSSLTILSARVPSSSMCTSASISACRNAPGILVTNTCLLYLVSIVHDIIIASNETVGELVSALVVYSCWLLPSAHPLAFIIPSLFYFRNIRYLSAFFLLSYDISSFFLGSSVLLSCSWFNSFSRI